MQRHLLAAIAAMGIALAADIPGYSAEPPVAEEDEPSVAAIGAEDAAVAPKDRKDVPIAVDPLKPEASEGIAANPRHPASLVAAVSTGLTVAAQGPCLVYRSSDAGRTWSMPVPLPQKASSHVCEHADVAYAPDGSRVYAAHSPLDYDIGAQNILISSSQDDGATWGEPIIALQGDPDYGSYRTPRIATALQKNEPNYVYLIRS